MPTVTRSSTVPTEVAATYLVPREDLVVEDRGPDGTFGLVDGPFARWHRTVTCVDAAPGTVTITESVTFKIAAPFWGVLFVPAVRRLVTKRHRAIAAGLPHAVDRMPMWLPPDRLDARSTSVLSTLVSLALIVGYLGTVITQSITFSAEEFGANAGDQSEVLASIRIGVLLSLAIVVLADRKGRRRLLLGSVYLAVITCALGALSTSMFTLAAAQTLSRAFSTSALVLLAVVAAEEMPAGNRAFAVSVMTLTAGLGAGICVWFLPLADTGPGGWRWLYVIPLVSLPLVWQSARHLPETKRFVRSVSRTSAKLTGHGKRLVMLCAALFAIAVFSAPASQLQNNFLRTEQGFSAARISLFTLLTSTPAGIGIVVGGHLADAKGRRIVGAIGVVGGALALLAAFLSHGWPLWALSLGGTVIGAAAVPALGVYGPELFPTSLRGKANGILQTAAVAGSSLGLLVVGWLTDRWGRLGPAMAVVVVGPLLVGVLLLVAYPETAHRELEELNPEDGSAQSTVDQPLP